MTNTNLIYISGGKKTERAIAEETVHWCLKKLVPRIRTLDINVEFRKIDAYGYCMEEDNRGREFTITIQKGLGLFDLVSTICHEMVHLKQYARRELRNVNGNTMWKTKAYNTVDYMDAPWEKEAYKLETILALECFSTLSVKV